VLGLSWVPLQRRGGPGKGMFRKAKPASRQRGADLPPGGQRLFGRTPRRWKLRRRQRSPKKGLERSEA